MSEKIQVHPLTKSRWRDLVDLFNRPGGSIVRGCWCMYYRKSGASSSGASGKKNKRALRALVNRDIAPGLVAYRAGRPIGWISLGPREDYHRLEHSPVMKPVDDKPVWSIICFFIDPKERGKGVSNALLKAGIAYARSKGAKLLEAYPIDKKERSHPDFMWFGAKSLYDQAGFTEIARRKPIRPVMRRAVRARS
jgi:GNAT superfamily N-acetyltransferase